jgi:hypothetical protein
MTVDQLLMITTLVEVLPMTVDQLLMITTLVEVLPMTVDLLQPQLTTVTQI